MGTDGNLVQLMVSDPLSMFPNHTLADGGTA